MLDVMPYQYLPYYSGGQKSIAQFLEYLGKKTDLSVITVPGNDETLATSYSIFPLLKKTASRYYDRRLVSTISSFVKERGIKTIIWEHPYYAWLAFRVRRKTGVSTIFHTHNIEYKRFRSLGKWWWPILRIYEKHCFKKADYIFFIAPEEMDFAVKQWKINPEKCRVVPFGVPASTNPEDKTECKKHLCQKHGIDPDEKILLFNGLLNYKPNLDALKAILDEINPLLLIQPSFRYKIIICGKSLPQELNSLNAYADKNIIYAGFVDDIETYFKGADIFLNPVQSGGGIKTKMVEAIGFGTTVVSTESGSAGIDRKICGEKLCIAEDKDWNLFSQIIIDCKSLPTLTPDAFYAYYSWENIISNIILKLEL
ncbi:MAG TPA: glycosyltransferase family 4 protein [Chitinophagaceae bacterium]|nr:glycosyltransferase family 4 protein [Chitinophagaceae bacterium]